MIDQHAGVNPKVTFNGLADKYLAIRTDADKTRCRSEGLKFQSFEQFKKICCKRQESNIKNLHVSDENKFFECQNCACGIAIMTGNMTKLPVNVGKIK